MAGLGAFNPSPQTFGGANSTTLEAIQNTLATAMGGGVASEKGTILWVENHATARVLFDLYGMCERFGNQFDPAHMTIFLRRWENIFGIRPLRNATLQERQRALAARISLLGKGTSIVPLTDYLQATLGSIYLGLEYVDPMNALSYVPGGAVVPGGPTLLDGNLLGPTVSPYYSTVGFVSILLAKPAMMSEEEFYERAANIYDTVDGLFAAWVGFDWFRDGVNGAGFYLDDEPNLDNERFD